MPAYVYYPYYILVIVAPSKGTGIVIASPMRGFDPVIIPVRDLLGLISGLSESSTTLTDRSRGSLFLPDPDSRVQAR